MAATLNDPNFISGDEWLSDYVCKTCIKSAQNKTTFGAIVPRAGAPKKICNCGTKFEITGFGSIPGDHWFEMKHFRVQDRYLVLENIWLVERGEESRRLNLDDHPKGSLYNIPPVRYIPPENSPTQEEQRLKVLLLTRKNIPHGPITVIIGFLNEPIISGALWVSDINKNQRSDVSFLRRLELGYDPKQAVAAAVQRPRHSQRTALEKAYYMPCESCGENRNGHNKSYCH